jgi:hypothetical protein
VIHQRQRLSLGLEAGDDAARVHPLLDHLQSDAAADRLILLCQIHDPHAAFTQDTDGAIGAERFRQMTAGTLARRVCLRRAVASIGGNQAKLQHAPRTRLTGLDLGTALRTTGVHDAPSEALQKRLRVSVTARDKRAGLLQ